MSDSFYGCQPSAGLHILKDAWCQKSHLGLQSRALAEQLPASIAATMEAAPVRHQGFRLNRGLPEVIHESEQERRLESAMMRRWGTDGMWPVPGAWSRLIACQVPLFDQQQKHGWGYVDLLGVSTSGLPVVVELKKAPDALADGKTRATETPLRMVLEAAAYAIALRKNWNSLRPEWIARLNSLDLPENVLERVPPTLQKVPLVAAAPASFWIDWLPVTEKGRTVSNETWLAFQSLLSEFNKENLPVSFVSISGHDLNIDGMAVQPLVGFPPVSCDR